MANKYYGSCSGNSGAKYDLWLDVTENSHSIENNTSYLSIKLYLKRNDGYSGSAYNLNENENFAKITINGTNKASKNLKIDTRNNVTVTLVTWSGDVKHNADGTLTISVGGSFTMGGTSLSGGSASGDFKCVTIPRTSSFVLNKTIANPNEVIAVTISSASTAFSHKLVFKTGDYRTVQDIAAGVTNTSFSIPSFWANAFPASQQGTISVTVKTYNNSTLVGTSTKYITLTIPATDEFLPDFNTSLTFNNSALPSGWNVVLQNISTVTAKVQSATGKYGSQIASAYIICNNYTKSGIEASFDLPNTGTSTVVFRVTDTRGFTRDKVQYFGVIAYSQPTVVFNSVYRCDSAGNPSESGAYAKIDFTTKFSTVNNLNTPVVRLRYKKSTDSALSNYVSLSSSPAIINGNFSQSSSYDFIIEITDKVTQSPFVVARTLSSGTIPFNIKSGGKGAAFGCYSENDNELTVGYDLNVKGKIKYNDLSSAMIIDSNFYKTFSEIKSFSCLGLTSIKCGFLTNASVAVNTWVKLFQITTNPPPVAVPLRIVTGNITVDKNIMAFIDKTGEVFICSEAQILGGYGIYISGVY